MALESTLPSQPSPLRPPPPQAATPAAEHHDELEEIEPDRDSGPPSSDKERAVAKKADKHDDDSLEEIEPADEIDAERISLEERVATEEIPVVMEVEPEEQPRRPPPPPKRADGAPAQAPSVPATPPPAPPTSGPVSKPAAKPAPPTKAETRKRPWWEEIFSEDFIRTMDAPKPSYVAREVNFIEESLGVEKGAVVLDLACGTGSHAVELASRGYSVVGFDLSLAMLARASDEAQERGQKLNFLQGDMREMAFEEMFDGIYCWSTSFGYFDEEKNADVLARAHRALRHGGMLLIDIINRDFIAPRQPSLVWFEGDGCVCMDEMHVDFFTSRLKVKRTVMFEDGRTREVDYSIRIYNLHEIGKMMHDCGFRVVQVTGQPAHPGVFFGSESPRIIVLAERAD
jgi:SAM-dependent methyltransferase